MTDVEYDSAAMKTAMSKLKDVYDKLDEKQMYVEQLRRTAQPGESNATTGFQKQLIASTKIFAGNHNARLREVSEALNALISIDREYNRGEIANELSLKTIRLEEGKG